MPRVLPLILLALLGGCSLAPIHQRPDVDLATSYRDVPDRSSHARVAARLGWADFFADPRLRELIGQAFEHNRDLRVAVLRIEETRGLYRIQTADRLPTLSLGAEAARGRFAPGSVPGASAGVSETYSVGVAVSAFELDFWGRVRSLSDAARAQFFASIEAQRAFRLSLIRDVATAYLGLREAAERIELAEATVRSRREGLRIARVRLDAGITSALDYNQAEALLTQAETQLAGIRLARAQNENLLALLTGTSIDAALPTALPLGEQAKPSLLEVGLPSSLLEARPDILAAEERLRVARANIGVARAAFFPRISLTGNLGYASDELNNLVNGGNQTWSIGPSVSLPLFDHGRNRANLSVAQARENIAVAEYEQAIRTAFREVSDALSGRRHLTEQLAAQARNRATLIRVVELARKRYREGVVGYIEVLDAERSLFDAEQAFIQAKRAQMQSLVDLYVALGGGVLEK